MTAIDVGDVAFTTCLCVEHLAGPLRADVHDALLAVEAGGMAAVAELLGRLAFDEENGHECHEPGTLNWFELGEFVSLHNWEDPIAMNRFASVVLWALRADHERQRCSV